MHRLIQHASVLGIIASLKCSAFAGDWPHFLGPFYNGRAAAVDVAGLWPEEGLKTEWEFKKGKGWACPTVVGESVLVFHRVEAEEVLDCLAKASGEVLWNYRYSAPYRDRYGASDGPRTSPVVYGGNVFIFGVTGLLHCVDLKSGTLRWKRDLASEFAMKQNFFGHGSTPLVSDGRIIVPVGGAKNRCVVALDARNGEVLWEAAHGWGAGYASAIPTRVQLGGKERKLILLFTGGESRPPTGGLLCIDAENGQILGEFPHRSHIAESVNASSPLVTGRQVFVTEGYGAGGVLCEILEDGALRKVWSSAKLGAQFMTPIEKDGFILGFDGQNPRLAELVCLDAKTGVEKWRDDFGGRFGRGNLVDLGDRGVLALGEFGELCRIKVNAEGASVEQRVRLFDAPETWTIPVVAGRRLFVSQNERGRDGSGARIICYGF